MKTDNRSTLQMVTLVFGALYLVVGILGFFPLLGGSLLHSLVNVVIGIAGLAAVTSIPNSRRFCQVVGVVLLLLGVLEIGRAHV